MLALEEVYDVTIVKDGQEAYDTVKTNMEKGDVFDLIFMDIQVRTLLPRGDKMLINTDANP
jgi:osomolarity two-component system sensor histidine kinase SLN1